MHAYIGDIVIIFGDIEGVLRTTYEWGKGGSKKGLNLREVV